MTLVLNNQEIEALLPMADCLPAIEASFRDLGNGQAVNRPRSDMYSPTPHEDARYVFKSMDGWKPAAPGGYGIAPELRCDPLAG